jgi:gamma-D-glutamyl-L-lysine dipeptidyl-peptidase
MCPLVALLVASGISHAVVVRPVANLYSRPSEDADVVSQAIYGSNLGILEKQNAWARVRTPDDYSGWMPLASLSPGITYAAGGRVAQVDSLFAHIYREPDVTRHAPLVTVPFETRLEVAAEPDDRWVRVRLPDDLSGWVQHGDVVFDPRPLSVEAAIELGKRFLGLPYTWGGTSSFGYDCSGFVQMLCRRRGIGLPRDAAPQAASSALAPVERGDLRPGDLLYFGSSASHITHTGMYIGDGKFLDATTYQHPAVRIDSLKDAHWAGLLVACRRPR